MRLEAWSKLARVRHEPDAGILTDFTTLRSSRRSLGRGRTQGQAPEPTGSEGHSLAPQAPAGRGRGGGGGGGGGAELRCSPSWVEDWTLRRSSAPRLRQPIQSLPGYLGASSPGWDADSHAYPLLGRWWSRSTIHDLPGGVESTGFHSPGAGSVESTSLWVCRKHCQSLRRSSQQWLQQRVQSRLGCLRGLPAPRKDTDTHAHPLFGRFPPRPPWWCRKHFPLPGRGCAKSTTSVADIGTATTTSRWWCRTPFPLPSSGCAGNTTNVAGIGTGTITPRNRSGP